MAEFLEAAGARGTIGHASQILKSSLLGQDPFGDKEMLPDEGYIWETDDEATDIEDEVEVGLEPEKETTAKPKAATESDGTEMTTAEADKEAAASREKRNAEEAVKAAEAARKKKARKKTYVRTKYSDAGLLLRKVQEQNRSHGTLGAQNLVRHRARRRAETFFSRLWKRT